MPASARRRRARPLALAVLAAVALACWLGVRGLAAERHLASARTALVAAKSALLDRQTVQARTDISSATRSASRARALTSDPVWRLAAAVPVAGNSLRAAAGIARALDEVTREVLPPALLAAEPLTGNALRTPTGAVDMGVLAAAGPQLAKSAAGLRHAGATLARLPTFAVLGPVHAARSTFAGELDQLSTAVGKAEQALQLAPLLLGEDRLRRYFVMVQQPGESRGTGGLTAGFAVLEADKGTIKVNAEGSDNELVNGDIPVPDGIGDDYDYEYGGNGGLKLWQNVNLSPDLPTVAKVVAARWKAQGGQNIDGVITLDPISISDLLSGQGPVDMGAGGRVAPSDIVRYLTVDQYRTVGLGPQDSRKQALEQAAHAVGARLTTNRSGTGAFLSGLVQAVRSGHLRMAGTDPVLQSALHVAGVDGALPTGEAPVAYPIVLNATENKLDSFLERSVAYRAGPCSGARRSSTITVGLKNNAPATGLPPYMTIREMGTAPNASTTDSAVILQVYGSADALLVSAELDGKAFTADNGPGRTRVYEGLEGDLPFWQMYVDLPRGQARTVVLHLDEAVVPGVARVPEQPLIQPLHRTVDVPTCS